MKTRAALCFTLLLTVILVSACYLPQSEAAAPVEQAGGIQTWIDAPLDGSTIPFAPYEIDIFLPSPSVIPSISSCRGKGLNLLIIVDYFIDNM